MDKHFAPNLITNEILQNYKISNTKKKEASFLVIEKHIRTCVEELMADRLDLPIDITGIYEEKLIVAKQYVDNDFALLHELWTAASKDKSSLVIDAVMALDKSDYAHNVSACTKCVQLLSQLLQDDTGDMIREKLTANLRLNHQVKELLATGDLTLGRLLQIQPGVIFSMKWNRATIMHYNQSRNPALFLFKNSSKITTP